MTEATAPTPAADHPADTPQPDTRPPDRQLQAFVQRRVRDLARRYTTDTAAGVAAVARLRRAVEHAPGSDPAIWPDTLADLPPALIGHTDRPSRYERAAHSAITLFAVHQQSKNTSMHRNGAGLGRAVRRLSATDFSEEATLRRFQALATASSYPETIHHLRGLITQLRSAGVALDYGLLSRDLARLQTPRTADSVRLSWGRDYHRRADDEQDTATGRPATIA